MTTLFKWPCPTVAALLLLPSLAGAQVRLVPADLIEAAGAAVVVAGDFDGDGRPDLAVLDVERQLTLHLQKATGTFTSSPAPVPPIEPTPHLEVPLFAAGDFNEDGRDDLVFSAEGGWTMLLSQPGGGWIRRSPPANARVGVSVPLPFDIDRDGHLDLVQAEQLESYPQSGHLIGSALHLYFGDGQGGLVAKGVLDAGDDNFHGIVAGHFNADPFVDIATAEGGAFLGEAVNLVLRYGHGGSGFSAPVRLPNHTNGIAAGDFDGDGRTDLITGGYPRPDGSRMQQYRQLPGGLIDSPRPLTTAGMLRTMQRLDADGDGRDDLVAIADAVNVGSADAWLLAWQQRDGHLQTPEQADAYAAMPMDNDGRWMTIGDFDGDGRDDVAEIVDGGVRLHLARPHVPSGSGTQPLAPTITGVMTEEGNDFVQLTVERPSGDGGSPILGYRVLIAPGGPYVRPVVAPAGTAPFTINLTLPLGIPYQVQVQAFNAIGDGAVSAPVPVIAAPLRTLRMDEYVYLPEGDAGPVVHQVPVRLNWPAGPGGVRFDVQSSSTNAGEAEPGVHYETVSLQGVFIPEGQTETTIPVTIIGNTIEDVNRHFILSVHNVTGARGSGLISWIRIQTEEFDPGPPLLYGLIGEVVEGDDGQQLVPVRFEFDKPLSGPVEVAVNTDPRPFGMNFVAIPPEDYAAPTIPNFTVQPGDGGGTIYLPVNGDTTEETDEIIATEFYVVSGPAQIAYNGGNTALTIIWDDDRVQPALHARADRIVMTQNTVAEFNVLGNDVFVDGRTDMPRTPYPDTAVGELHVVPNNVGTTTDDAMVFRAAPGFVGTHRQPYELCEYPAYSWRCVPSELEIVVRPIPEQAVTFDASAAGHRDIILEGLQAMPAARFEATPLVRPLRRDVVLAGDPEPISPWDSMAGTEVSFHPLARPADGLARTWRVLVDAHTLDSGDVDLYLGVDTDNDGTADMGELRCTAAMVPSGESCELEIDQPGDTAVAYWVMLHNRGTTPLPARADIAAVRVDSSGDRSLVATGPGQLRQGERFALRLAWNDPSFLPGERRVGYLRVRATADDAGGLVPVRLARPEGAGPIAPMALASGQARSFALPAGSAHRRLFIDVPEGATTLAVQTRSAQPVDLHLVPAGIGSSPQIDEAPPISAAAASSATTGGNEDALVEAPASGRWYVVVDNSGASPAAIEVTATVTAVAPVVRPGSYFNPDRGGHGLVLYPAANQWAGLWYTYFQDGTPTWLYLQAKAPGPNGLWTAPIYRTAWTGDAQNLVQVGTATVTPTGPDAFRFTWTFDGETGSEPLQALGRGCPTLAGTPLDASSHWFDAAHAGTGYSVQLWPDYEMYLAFVYDAQGLPRFLIAEGSGFGGGDRVLALEQLQGFCPLCARPAAPGRRTVGSFQRTFGDGTIQVGIDGLYEPVIPGWWSADDVARPLGGPGTTQGCAP